MTSTAAFISDLVRAANEIETLTGSKRARLLKLAASAIRDYRDQIDCSEAPANDTGPGDIIDDLKEVARNIKRIPPAEVADLMLDAAETIKAAQVLLKEKRKIENGSVGEPEL